MKKRLFLVLLFYIMQMQIAFAGSKMPGDGSSDYEIKTGPGGYYGVNYNDGPEDENGMVDRTFTTEYQNRSSGSLEHIEKTKSRVCVSVKCNPSDDTDDKDDKTNDVNTIVDQPTTGNKQALDQITINANKLANDAANTVVVPPPDPCIANPSICGPPPDPCIANPSLCGPPPIDPCILDPVACVLP